MLEVKSRPCFLTPKRLKPEFPLFVFLPGMDGTGQLLRSQTSGLEVAFDVRCLAIPPDDMSSWDALTKEVLALIRQEIEKNPHRSVYLCGESFGGCLAMRLSVTAPQLFTRIVLINPASAFHRRALLNWISPLAYLVPSCLFPVGAIGLLPFIAALERISPSDRQELLKTMRSVPAETVLWRLSLIRDFDVDEIQLNRLTQPVLMIASERDRLLPSVTEAMYLSNSLPNVQTLVLPHSGHACLLETDIQLYEIMSAENFFESSLDTENKEQAIKRGA